MKILSVAFKNFGLFKRKQASQNANYVSFNVFGKSYSNSINFCGKRKTNATGNRQKSTSASPNIVHSPLGDVSIPQIPFHELVFKDMSLWEKKTAIMCGATGRNYTYKKLKQFSEALAKAFQNKFKLKKNDFVALILPNCPEYPIAILASSMTGVVPTTVNPTYTVDEIQTQLSECNVKLIMTDHKNHEKCTQVLKGLNLSVPVLVVRTTKNAERAEGAIDVFEIFNSNTLGNLTPVDFQPEDPLVLPFSSGTTGSPKGVILTHKNVVSNLVQISHPETVIMNPTTRFHQDTILGVVPMFHIYGLVIVTFYSLKDGCRLIVLPRFDPRLYLITVIKNKANILYVVPPLMNFLSNDKISSRYLKNVEFVVNAAAPMALKSAHKILEKSSHVKIGQGYGMTEASPALAHTSTKRMQKLATIGIPIASTKFKITCLETGEPLPKGKEGELCAWGPQVMKGYFNRPEDTKNAFDKEGWLRTGDIAYYDDDGDFFVVDRIKNLIKVKGFQVAPAELEEALTAHPKIREVAVIGIKNEDFGEVPRAYVVLAKGAQMTEDEVKEMISKKMSSYKQLRGGVKFVDELPKNSAGKIDKKLLEQIK